MAAREIPVGLALEKRISAVDVRLRGMKQDMEETEHGVAAFVSCAGLKAGEHLLPVQVVAPEGVSVVAVRPPEVVVSLEPIITESKQIELKLVGAPAPQYELLGAEVSPKFAQISGPRSRVDQVAEVAVSANLDRADPEVPTALPLYALDSGGNRVGGLTIDPPRARVVLRVKHVVASRTVPVVVRTRGPLPEGLKIESVQVEPAMVSIVGPADRVREVSQIETSDLLLNTVRARPTRKLGLVVPDGVNLLNSSSVTVTVKLGRALPLVSSQEQQPEED